MTLLEKEKTELRKQIEEKLKNVLEGERVVLDNELLDELIFFKGKNIDGLTIKVPVWTGPFLSKIDLSGLSFENVYFYTGEEAAESMDAEPIEKFAQKKDCWGVHYCIPVVNGEQIDFSNTNIIIDFSKLYRQCIHNCNFSGVDLSNSNFGVLEFVYDSNFSNTGIKINRTKEPFEYENSDFSNNDFSEITIPFFEFHAVGGGHFMNCNFSNTGLNIDYDTIGFNDESIAVYNKIVELHKNAESAVSEEQKCEWKRQAEEFEHLNFQQYLEVDARKELGNMIKSGYLDGCYINGKYITSTEEKKANADAKWDEYKNENGDIVSSVSADLDEQIGRFKR